MADTPINNRKRSTRDPRPVGKIIALGAVALVATYSIYSFFIAAEPKPLSISDVTRPPEGFDGDQQIEWIEDEVHADKIVAVSDESPTRDSTLLRITTQALAPSSEANTAPIASTESGAQAEIAAMATKEDGLIQTLTEKEAQIAELKSALEVAVSSTQFTGNKTAKSTTPASKPTTPAVDPCKDLQSQIASLKRQIATKDQAFKKSDQDLKDLQKKYDQLTKQSKDTKTSSAQKPAQGAVVANDERYAQLKRVVDEQKQALQKLENARLALAAEFESKYIQAPSVITGETAQYTVKKGDTLFEIARSFYGNGNRWKEIYDTNKEALGDGKNLKVGLVLEIPNAPRSQ